MIKISRETLANVEITVKKTIWVILSLLVISFSVGDVQAKPSREVRTLMGFLPIPRQPLTQEAWVNAFELLQGNGDLLLHHAQLYTEEWELFAQGTEGSTNQIASLNFITAMSRQYRLQYLIAVDPLAPGARHRHTIPSSLGQDFGAPAVRQAFKNYTVRIVQDYQPKYLALFSEVNTYLAAHPEDFHNVASLVKETRDLVKALSPECKIMTTFQFDEMSGRSGSPPQWELLKAFATNDMVGITTYPALWFATPQDIPDDYYSQVMQHTNLPIVVAESGWPSGGAPAYHGSLEKQRDFIYRFAALMKPIKPRIWIWWFLHDWDGSEYPEYFRTMGVRTFYGQEKPSWDAWREVRRRR